MTARSSDRRILIAALALSLVALVVMIGDKLANPDIVNRETFDLLQLVFSAIALTAGVVVVVRAARRPAEDDQIIDLRERLADLVDIDDAAIDEAMDVRG